MDTETLAAVGSLEIADATREQAAAIKGQTAALETYATALKGVTKGDTGDQGEIGPQGPQGDQGPFGPKGDRGPQGRDGATGPQGPAGTDGAKGDRGPAGADGVGPDERVRVSPDDPVAGFLADKLTAGSGVEIRKASGKMGERLVIDAKPQGVGGGQSGIIVYDDGAAVGTGNKISFDGGAAPSISGGIIHVPVGSSGSGLPAGGTPGQVVTNTAPGVGDWENAAGGLPPQWTDGGSGDVTVAADAGYSPINVPLNADVYDHPPIKGVTGGTGVDGATVIIKAGDGNGELGYGVAFLELDGNYSNGDAGGALFVGGDGAPSGGTGGQAGLQAGDGVLAAGGDVGGKAGDSDTGFQGGNIDLAGGRGDGGLTNGGKIIVTGGGLTENGGVSLQTNLGSQGVYVYGSVIHRGYVVAPADGDLIAGDFSLWFDDTPGATALKIKAKDSAGTVVTATVPLT